MEEKFINDLNKLMLEYSNIDYLDGFYSKLMFYNIAKEKLTIILYPEGMPHEHSALIQEIVNKLVNILPKDLVYRLTINGWFCDVTNGDFNLSFEDGKYYIEPVHQEMHEKKEIVTIKEIADLNNISYSELKWNLLKNKSIELGFTPVKDKSGNENLYSINAFKQCYPHLNYDFNVKNRDQNEQTEESKRKKFFGLF